jgi:hypothetical protein
VASSPVLVSPPPLPAVTPERAQDEMEVDEPSGSVQSEDKEPDKSTLSMQADVDSGFENMEVEEGERLPQETRRRRVRINELYMHCYLIIILLNIHGSIQ